MRSNVTQRGIFSFHGNECYHVQLYSLTGNTFAPEINITEHLKVAMVICEKKKGPLDLIPGCCGMATRTHNAVQTLLIPPPPQTACTGNKSLMTAS